MGYTHKKEFAAGANSFFYGLASIKKGVKMKATELLPLKVYYKSLEFAQHYSNVLHITTHRHLI